MSQLKMAVAAVALTAASGAANALSYLDTAWVDSLVGAAYVNPTTSVSYVHDLTSDPTNEYRALLDGYFPPDLVDEASLTLWFVDDGEALCSSTRPYYQDCSNSEGWLLTDGSGEQAYVNPEGLSNLNRFSTGDIATLLNGGTQVTQDLDFFTIQLFQWDGKLDVTVSSKSGDFYLVKSELNATGKTVPVPGALALLGIGALGLGLTMRRKSGK